MGKIRMNQNQVIRANRARMKKEFDALYTKLDSTPNRPARTHATGGDTDIETDC